MALSALGDPGARKRDLVPEREGFSYFREAICRPSLGVAGEPDATFAAKITQTALGRGVFNGLR